MDLHARHDPACPNHKDTTLMQTEQCEKHFLLMCWTKCWQSLNYLYFPIAKVVVQWYVYSMEQRHSHEHRLPPVDRHLWAHYNSVKVDAAVELIYYTMKQKTSAQFGA